MLLLKLQPLKSQKQNALLAKKLMMALLKHKPEFISIMILKPLRISVTVFFWTFNIAVNNLLNAEMTIYQAFQRLVIKFLPSSRLSILLSSPTVLFSHSK
jgi:hypothetical protein